MRVLVACEESQEVCKAFRARGHEAYSCDVIPCSGGHPEWHIIEDVQKYINNMCSPKGIADLSDYIDLIIAHPPCTRLANSGVRWLKERNLWDELKQATEFFNFFISLHKRYGISCAIENPIPHKYANLPRYTQIIQPYQFGHGERKATCLWLFGLPELKPTDIVEGREQRIWKMAPSADRAKNRSKTFPGIAKAMAEQWG